MIFEDLLEPMLLSILILFYTLNNLFALFIQLLFGLYYTGGISEEITFFFYSFFSILLWIVIICYLINFRTPRDSSNPNKSFKDKFVNFFIRKNIKKLYFNLNDKLVFYGVLLSVLGGFIGLFSLGNLYYKLYKRFIVQFIPGLIFTILNLITIYNFPLTLHISDITFYVLKNPFFALMPVIYYLITVNDTYECALSIKNNCEFPSLSKIDILLILYVVCALFLITINNIPSLWIFGEFTISYGCVILVGVAFMSAIFLD
ncbi:MAG: hypothetical protein IKF79_03660 [Methanosphaera sp.]|nr:hypothetical protein [Methanosphaera sp.]